MRALDFFPDWREFNPFQTLLYSDLERVDAEARPVGDLRRHLLARAASRDPGVLHVHWTTPVLRSVGGAEQARAKVDAIVAALDDYAAAGGRLVWTVHNVLPHEAAHHEDEVRLAQALADRADVVHVMSMSTLALTAPDYRLDPARVSCIPHSSYRGVYPDWVSRAGARRRLGLADDDRVLLSFGHLRPYKGVDRLLDYVESSSDPDERLLVAGPMARRPGARDLRRRLRSSVRTHSVLRRVPDDRIQVWMRAADVAVLPYTRVLNSGAFLLAETFGLPVVAPRDGALAEREGEAHVRLFGDDDFDQVLTEAMADLVVDPVGAREARASADRAAYERPVEAMAASFADLVAPLLEFTRP
jgi:glycosyltransferase involved in cell wall biosynthesis